MPESTDAVLDELDDLVREAVKYMDFTNYADSAVAGVLDGMSRRPSLYSDADLSRAMAEGAERLYRSGGGKL